jgi:glyoxylase-like metal-dependent hydrolase (beta-lactamase superfamily II)
MLRAVLAPNASALTLEGTRTYLVGRDRVVIIDPGSDDPAHLGAIARELEAGVATAIVVTHGHPDHEAGADTLAERCGAPVRMARRGTLRDGDRLDTDAGMLAAVATPGHTTDHFALHWPDEGAVFCGDLMMGGQQTALVAAPEGRLGAYLASLERIRGLRPDVIHPAHGPSFEQPDEAVETYLAHRRHRLNQVLSAVREGASGYDAILHAVYGDELDPTLERAAMRAVKAYLEHLQATGGVRRRGRGWEAVAS